MSEPNYYYNKAGAPTGPITIVQLKELATSGQVKPTDLVWREGTPSWVPAATVKGLFSSTAPAAGSPPPQPASSGPPPMTASSTSATSTSASSTPPPAASSRPNWSTQSEDAKAAAEYARNAASKAREASQQAWGAVKTLVADPVGGIGPSFESLGANGALAVGAVFAVVYLVCPIIGSIFGATAMGLRSGGGWFGNTIVGLIVDTATIATMVGVSYLYRLKTRSGGASVGADMLIVGAALLPIAIARLVAALFKWDMNLIVLSVSVFAGCFCVMLLFSGLTKISKLSERVATVAVPLMLVAALGVATLLYRVF
jgi:hypothetical protein